MSYTPPLSHGSHNHLTTCHEKGNSNLNQPPQCFRCVHLDLLNVFGTKILPKWWFDGDLSWYKGKNTFNTSKVYFQGGYPPKFHCWVHAASEMSHPINLNRAQPDSAQMRSISPRVKCVLQHKIPLYAE